MKHLIYTNKIIIFLWLCSAFYSCRNDIADITRGETSVFSISKEHDSLYFLKIKADSTNSVWKLSYPVYRFQEGDVNGDHVTDALVGVIKPTRFDSTVAKRLFIFKNYHNLVRPLWLGSRLGRPLVDFNLVATQDGSRIRSIEKEQNGNYLVAEYKWRTFGLEFVKYIQRDIDSSRAVLILTKK